MALDEDLESDVKSVIDTTWTHREGRVVPSSEDVALAGGAVELEATMLYADLANSSSMANELDRRIAAKILKSFLATTSRLVRSRGGTIVSFDGDRILGVFVGATKNTDATRCALNINYTVQRIIRPTFEAKYDAVRKATFTIEHGCGIDTGTVLAVRAGARGANDLIWIGRAPNLAAKLSDLRESPYRTVITASVYNKIGESAKFHSGIETGDNMWEPFSWAFLGQRLNLYKSNWMWRPGR